MKKIFVWTFNMMIISQFAFAGDRIDSGLASLQSVIKDKAFYIIGILGIIAGVKLAKDGAQAVGSLGWIIAGSFTVATVLYWITIARNAAGG